MTLGLAPIVAMFGVSYVFVLAWVGAAYRTSGVIALLLGAGYAINLATGVGTALAMGAGRPDLDRNYSALGLFLNLTLTLLLGFTVGRWGVVIATALGLVISSAWLLYSVDSWLGTAVLSLRGIGGTRTSAGLVAVAVGLGTATTAFAMRAHVSSRLAACSLVAACLGAFMVLWVPLCVRAGALNVRRFLPPRLTHRDG